MELFIFAEENFNFLFKVQFIKCNRLYRTTIKLGRFQKILETFFYYSYLAISDITIRF